MVFFLLLQMNIRIKEIKKKKKLNPLNIILMMKTLFFIYFHLLILHVNHSQRVENWEGK